MSEEKIKDKTFLEKLFATLKNRYVIVLLIFIVWVGFLDRNNIIKTIKVHNEVKELKSNKEYYLKQIDETKKIRKELLNNNVLLEEFAREKYFMRKEGEDVFVVEIKE
ncbi:MAG: septum formation initiator family protein [Bacteroidota bacterium]|nr:septum formation initiator family protein [Bacteroidota bacterium]